MNDRVLRRASGSLAVVGAAIAGYLIYVRETGANLACATGGCETVQSSRYADLFGIPVAALGLVAYLTLLVIAFVPGEKGRQGQMIVALSGVLFGAYLLYIQLQVIDAVCEWCLASDLIMGVIATIALVRVKIAGPVRLEEKT